MDKIDFKKEYKDLYQPSCSPMLIEVPKMLFISIDGCGDPNTGAEYKEAIEILYGLSYAIKISKNGQKRPKGYFDYVVAPLEGLWGIGDDFFDYNNAINKDSFVWTSMIRQPDFVTENVFCEAKQQLSQKKPRLDVDKARLMLFEEGLCVQMMHKGSYDDEPATVGLMQEFTKDNGYIEDFESGRRHHEIYLSDPRRCAPDRLRTVIRHPVRKV